MAKQSLRQQARRRVNEAAAPWQKERLERERRVQAQAVDLLAALAERDPGQVVMAKALLGTSATLLLAVLFDEPLPSGPRATA